MYIYILYWIEIQLRMRRYCDPKAKMKCTASKECMAMFQTKEGRDLGLYYGIDHLQNLDYPITPLKLYNKPWKILR